MREVAAQILRMWVVVLTAYALLLPIVLVPASADLAAGHGILCLTPTDAQDGGDRGPHVGMLCCVLCTSAAPLLTEGAATAEARPLSDGVVAASPAVLPPVRGPPPASPRQPRAPPLSLV